MSSVCDKCNIDCNNQSKCEFVCISHELVCNLRGVFDKLENSVQKLIKMKQCETHQKVDQANNTTPNCCKEVSTSAETLTSDLYSSDYNRQKSPLKNDRVLTGRSTAIHDLLDKSGMTEQSAKTNSESYSESLDYVLSLGPRLIGEIAFQLDRRIVMHIFEDKFDCIAKSDSSRRYYGYATTNIDKMIEIENDCNDVHQLYRRKCKILSHLNRKTGYALDKHSLSATRIINKHGLLKQRDSKSIAKLNRMSHDAIKSAIVRMSDSEEFLDILTLLQSLKELAKGDKLPLFYW